MDQGRATPDIAFLGASIVEEMSGKWFGKEMDANLKDLKELFEKNFQKSQGAKLEAVALGVAGDTVRTVLLVLVAVLFCVAKTLSLTLFEWCHFYSIKIL